MGTVTASQHIASEACSQFLRRARSVPIRNQAGRVVGSVRMVGGRLTFLKFVTPELHQLRHPPAWATDWEALHRARRAGAEFLCLRERNSSRKWWSTLDAFQKHGLTLSRGHGEQVALPLKFWRVEDGPAGPQQVVLFPQVAP